ncbi:MAG: hypothetical protein Q9207_007549 [Kuettlingeria erythrocarpa]
MDTRSEEVILNGAQTDGPVWQLHRKVTGPPLNERRSPFVWDESIRQAEEVGNVWAQRGSSGTYDTQGNSMTLTFHVLANTGFGTDLEFKSVEQNPTSMYTVTWSKATNTVRENLLLVFATPKWILSLPYLPARWTNAGLAMKELRRYMEERVEGEQRHLIQGLPGSGNLLSSLVRGSEQAKKSPVSATQPSLLEPGGLSKADILGDMFAFSLAGHETIGNVLTFAIYLLAAHPEVQTWV